MPGVLDGPYELHNGTPFFAIRANRVSAVAIVGGGPAGCQLAVQLARTGISVRLIAGAPKSKVYFETLSARAAELAPESDPFVSQRSAWGGPRIQEKPAILSPWGGDRLVDRPELDLALRIRAKAAGADIIHGEVQRVEGVSGCWRLFLDSGRKVGATIVVDATGRARRIARQLGAPRAHRFDRLVAYPAKLLCTNGAKLTAAIHVLADREGWWFLGPGKGDTQCALYFTDSDLIGRSRLGTIASSWFRVRDCLSDATYVEEILPLQLAHSEALGKPWGAGWLAIGDAAAALDPLSSSGLYFAQTSADWALKAILTDDFDAYGEAVSRLVDVFRETRRRVYRGERRFADEVFWRRRQAGTTVLAADRLEGEEVQ